MNIGLFFVIIRAHLFLILFILAVTVTTAVIITDLMPRQYVSTTSLIMDNTEGNPLSTQVLPLKSSDTYMATQLDIIQSRNVALKVVDDLKLENNQDLKQEYLESGVGGEDSFREWLAQGLLDNLTVEPSRDSRVISISYQSTEPAVAALTANTFATAYIATSLELMVEPAKRNAAWFDEQLKSLRERLLAAQTAQTEFQQQSGIISLDEKLDTETERLNELSKSYVQVQSETEDIKARQLGERHPEYIRAVSRERALARSLREQKELILELKNQRDQLAVQAREVESNQQLYDATLQRFYQNSMESKFNQPNISILTPAVAPTKPSSPILLLNIASAIFLGLMLGVILSIIIEMRDRRIRTDDDVTELLDTKVLATI